MPGSGDDCDVISHPTAATKYSVYLIVHEVKQRVTHPGTNRDLNLRCLTSWKSQPLYLLRNKGRLPQQGCRQVREMMQKLHNAAIALCQCLCSMWYSEHGWYFWLTWKLYKILFDSQRFASCNIYYLKTYASTECLKQTSTLQTFAFIMNWMKYHVVSSFVTYGSFFVSARGIKIQ